MACSFQKHILQAFSLSAIYYWSLIELAFRFCAFGQYNDMPHLYEASIMWSTTFIMMWKLVIQAQVSVYASDHHSLYVIAMHCRNVYFYSLEWLCHFFLIQSTIITQVTNLFMFFCCNMFLPPIWIIQQIICNHFNYLYFILN